MNLPTLCIPSVVIYNDLSDLEKICQIATVVIAALNVIFVLYIFLITFKRDGKEKERDRKIELFKTLILDENLKYFYSSFDEIEHTLFELTEKQLNDDEKKVINTKLQYSFKKIRRNFTDLLSAVDIQLFGTIRNKSDELQDYITTIIFDGGYNLSHIPKFEEKILEPFIKTKIDIIKILVDYRG